MKPIPKALGSLALLVMPLTAPAFDYKPFFQDLRSPACPGVELEDVTITKCEFDQSLIPQNRCNEQAPLHKRAVFSTCRALDHPVVDDAQLKQLTATPTGVLALGLLSTLITSVKPPLPDLSLLGEYMPKGACDTPVRVLTQSQPRPGFFVFMDNTHPTWRSCLNQHAENIRTKVGDHPRNVLLKRAEAVVVRIDLQRGAHIERVKAVILAMDSEPSRPTIERVLTLLGDDWN